MKVIKAPDRSWSTKLNCSKCTALLEVSLDDFRIEHDRDGPLLSFKCGHCGQVDYPRNAVPRDLHILVQRGRWYT